MSLDPKSRRPKRIASTAAAANNPTVRPTNCAAVVVQRSSTAPRWPLEKTPGAPLQAAVVPALAARLRVVQGARALGGLPCVPRPSAAEATASPPAVVCPRASLEARGRTRLSSPGSGGTVAPVTPRSAVAESSRIHLRQPTPSDRTLRGWPRSRSRLGHPRTARLPASDSGAAVDP